MSHCSRFIVALTISALAFVLGPQTASAIGLSITADNDSILCNSLGTISYSGQTPIAVSGSSCTSTGTRYTITPTVSPATAGTIATIPASPLASGTKYVAIATLNSGYSAVGWSGASCAPPSGGAQPFCVLTVVAGSNAPVLTAQATTTYSVAGAFSPTAAGTLSLSPSSPVASGTSVVATATLNSGYAMTGWSGVTCASGTGGTSNTCRFTVTSNTTVTALAAATPTYYQLAATVSPSTAGSISLSPGSVVTAGTVVTATATLNSGYAMTGWSGVTCAAGTGGTSNTCRFTASSAVTVTALAARSTLAITASISPTLAGSIAISPASPVQYGTSVTATATLNSGYALTGWSGATCDSGTGGTTNTCRFTATTATTLIATAGLKTYAIGAAVSPVGAGTISLSPASPVSAGTSVTATLVPATGYKASSWSGVTCTGGTGGATNTCRFTPTSATNIVANVAAAATTYKVQASYSGSPATFTFSPSASAWPKGSTVQITATSSSTATIVTWYGCTSFTGAGTKVSTCTINNLSSNTVVTVDLR